MATARETAQQQLGNLDLSHLNQERDVARNIYDTSKTGLENNFNNLIEQINTNRESTRKGFNTGRATVAEESFGRNRANELGLASSVAGQTGLKDLAKVGNRMETGRQYSNLANTFYNDMGQLDTTEKQGRTQLEIDRQNLINTLDQALAGIGSREADTSRGYNQALAQLAEGIQGRWDSNANAKASLAQQAQIAAAARAQQSKALAQQEKAMAAANKSTAQQNLIQILSTGDTKTKKAGLQEVFGLSPSDAQRILEYHAMAPIDTGDLSKYGGTMDFNTIMPEIWAKMGVR